MVGKDQREELKLLTNQAILPTEEYMRIIKDMCVMDFISNIVENEKKSKLGKFFVSEERKCYEKALIPAGDTLEESIATRLLRCLEEIENRKKQNYEKSKSSRYSIHPIASLLFFPLLLLEIMSHNSYSSVSRKRRDLENELRDIVKRITNKSPSINEIDRYTREEIYNKFGLKINIYNKDLIEDVDKYLTAKNIPFSLKDKNPDALKLITADIDYIDKNGNKHIGKDILIKMRNNNVVVIEIDFEKFPKEQAEELKKLYKSKKKREISTEEYNRNVLFILGIDEDKLKNTKNGLDIIEEYIYKKTLHRVFGNTNQ